VLLAAEGIAALANSFKDSQGLAVLIAVAACRIVFDFMLLWFIFALLCRWRFQFSLRSLLCLTVAVAVPLQLDGGWRLRQRGAEGGGGRN